MTHSYKKFKRSRRSLVFIYHFISEVLIFRKLNLNNKNIASLENALSLEVLLKLNMQQIK